MCGLSVVLAVVWLCLACCANGENSNAHTMPILTTIPKERMAAVALNASKPKDNNVVAVDKITASMVVSRCVLLSAKKML